MSLSSCEPQSFVEVACRHCGAVCSVYHPSLDALRDFACPKCSKARLVSSGCEEIGAEPQTPAPGGQQ